MEPVNFFIALLILLILIILVGYASVPMRRSSGCNCHRECMCGPECKCGPGCPCPYDVDGNLEHFRGLEDLLTQTENLEHIGIVGTSGMGAVGRGLAPMPSGQTLGSGGGGGAGGYRSAGTGTVIPRSGGGRGGGWGGRGGHGGGWGGHGGGWGSRHGRWGRRRHGGLGHGYYGHGYIGGPLTSTYPYWAYNYSPLLAYNDPYYYQQKKLYDCFDDCPSEPLDDRKECYDLCRDTYLYP